MGRVFNVLFLLQVLAAAGYSEQADVSLTIRTLNDQSVFQIGQAIELELSFTGTAPNSYRIQLSPALSEVDRVAIEPRSGWDDPLSVFHNSCLTAWEGGLESDKVLSFDPTVVVLVLNERMRFKYPGVYRISVESDRVVRLSSEPGRNGVNLQSNVLSLSVIPATEQWQQQTLESAVADLDRPESTRVVSRDRQVA